MEQWVPVITILAAASPGLIVHLIGAIVSVVYWQRTPLPSKLLLAASIGLSLLIILQAFAQGWYYPAMMGEGHLSAPQVAMRGAIFTISYNVLYAGMFALLIWAVFAGRRKETE